MSGDGLINWMGVPLIATGARLLCRELVLQSEYLRLENNILKSKVPGRLRFNDEELLSDSPSPITFKSILSDVRETLVRPRDVNHITSSTGMSFRTVRGRRLLNNISQRAPPIFSLTSRALGAIMSLAM